MICAPRAFGVNGIAVVMSVQRRRKMEFSSRRLTSFSLFSLHTLCKGKDLGGKTF